MVIYIYLNQKKKFTLLTIHQQHIISIFLQLGNIFIIFNKFKLFNFILTKPGLIFKENKPIFDKKLDFIVYLSI